MTELSTPNTSPNHQVYHCNFPTAICGRLIGRQGKNINFIKEKSGANITLSANPFTPEFQLCSIEGTIRIALILTGESGMVFYALPVSMNFKRERIMCNLSLVNTCILQ